MSERIIPHGWKEVISYAERIRVNPAYISEIESYRQTNSDTLLRICMQDEPPFLPGALQSEEYILGIFKEESDDIEGNRREAMLRLGLWSTYLSCGGRIEASVHPDALEYRPGGIGNAALHNAFLHATQCAQQPQVDFRMRHAAAAPQKATWRIGYQNGVENGISQAAATIGGIVSVLPVNEGGWPSMEAAWQQLSEHSYDTATSLKMLQQASDSFTEVEEY